MLQRASNLWQRLLTVIKPVDGIPPLLVRIYLAPVMLQAGYTKLVGFDNTVNWFDNMGVPLPFISAGLAALAEFIGGILLIFGLATRLIAIPLMFTMLVAALLVHWDNGWLTLSDGQSWLANERVLEAQEKKREIRNLVREHGDYRDLTRNGQITILNNGIQLAATYFLFLLVLLFTGGGRYTSLDYWIREKLIPKPNSS